MGCSYDHPSPSQEEVQLGNDKFTYNKFSPPTTVTCLTCGTLVVGSPYQRKFIDIHIKICPARKT